MNRYLFLLILILSSTVVFGETITVKQDGSGDYIEIQAAINASEDGDLVLVYPGRYYENLILNGKNITLASFYISEQSETYIDNTIVDGSLEQESCIRVNGETVTISGFSITNGFGSDDYMYGGGGGVSIVGESNVHLEHCKVYNNYAYSGGGVVINQSTACFKGVDVYNNRSGYTGGIRISHNNTITFDGDDKCNIYNNFGRISDISVNESTQCNVVLDTFTVIELDKYFIDVTGNLRDIGFSAEHAWLETINHDLYVATDGDDGNSGLTPDEPLRTIAVAMHRIESDSLNPKTIYVAEGTYSRSLNNQIFPISCKDYVNVVGAGRDLTILDDDQTHNLITMWKSKAVSIYGISLINSYNTTNVGTIFIQLSEQIKFENMRIENCSSWIGAALDAYKLFNVRLKDIIVKNNTGYFCTGFYLRHINGTIEDCVFDGNRADYNEEAKYSALYAWVYDSLKVNNCIFINNFSQKRGPIAVAPSSEPYSDSWANIELNNCLIANNTTQNQELCYLGSRENTLAISNCSFIDNIGPQTATMLVGSIDVENCIFDNETYYEILVPDESYLDLYSELTISYSDVIEIDTRLRNSGGVNTINFGDGLIDTDPLIEGGEPTNYMSYMLSANSPCIDAGTPDTTGLHLPPWDIIGNPRIYGDRIDMGCYEWNPDGLAGDYRLVPKSESSLYNYPNPFNPQTTIHYTTSRQGYITLNIYNIKGQLIKTLMNGQVSAGYHSIVWDSTNNTNESVSSGVYFCRMASDSGETATKKMLLLK